MAAVAPFQPPLLPASAPLSSTSSSPSIQRITGGLPPKSKSAKSGKDLKTVRGRRERPCDACRKRKSKCVINDGQKNTCAACGVHGQECTYLEDPQPRKRRMDGEGKEIDANKRRSTISDSQSESTADGSISTKRGSVSSRAMSGRSVPTPSISESSLSNLQHYGTHIGYTTELEPILFDISQTAGTPVNRASYQKPDRRNAFILDRTEDDKFENDLYSDSLLIIENLVGSHGPSLVQHFKTMTNRNFPIVEDAFFHIYESYQRSSLDPALLSAVYAIAASSPAYVNEAAGSVELDLVQVEDIAFRWFAHSISKPTLSTIQAGILLMQRPNIDSKTLNSQLVGIAYELGLHLDCSSWTLSEDERSLRKRLAWALYMQDKWCSLIHGRPSSISKNHWAVRELGEDDFVVDNNIPDDRSPAEEVKRGRDLFCQMVALTEILSTVLDTFYTLKAMQEVDDAGQNGTRLILEKAKPVQLRLKEWFMHLPRSLKMDSTMTGKPSATGYLHLAYFATEITLHRCIIRSLSATSADTYLSHVCRSAAKTRLISAMDFVNRLRPEHLSSFWYFPSKVNFALIATFGNLLLATAPCQEEVEFYRTRLSEYRWTLCVSCKSAKFLAFAIHSLDSSLNLLKSLPPKPSISEVSPQPMPAPARPMQGPSPPQDEVVPAATPMYMPQFPQYPASLTPQPSSVRAFEAGRPSSTASGLVTPSISSSGGSTTSEAFREPFGNMRPMDPPEVHRSTAPSLSGSSLSSTYESYVETLRHPQEINMPGAPVWFIDGHHDHQQ